MQHDVRISGTYPHVLALLTYGVLERAAGARYLTTADWLRGFYSRSNELRAEWQRERLAEVVGHAASQVPYYRQLLAGRDPTQVELTDLPIVDKAQIRTHQDAFLSVGWRNMPYVRKKTGGSTGDPWQYPLDRQAWQHIYGAAIHQRERVGYRYGEPMVLLGAPTSLRPSAQTWRSSLRHRLERHHTHLTGFDITRSASAERARRADEAGAAIWYGYASTIATMAEAVLDEQIPIRGPRAIITTAEVLQQGWRRQIEAAFGPNVFDEYGCNDGGIMAQTCRASRYHLAENASVVELLNGERPCKPGEEGEVVVTNLHARVLPFLRYRIGDRAVLGEGACPCGLAGATLERVVGRSGDHLQLQSGHRISPLAFGPVFMDTPGVRKWQLVQTAPTAVKVRLEVGEDFDERQRDLIYDYTHRLCQGEASVWLTTQEPLDRTQGGKYRVIVREFADQRSYSQQEPN